MNKYAADKLWQAIDAHLTDNLRKPIRPHPKEISLCPDSVAVCRLITLQKDSKLIGIRSFNCVTVRGMENRCANRCWTSARISVFPRMSPLLQCKNLGTSHHCCTLEVVRLILGLCWVSRYYTVFARFLWDIPTPPLYDWEVWKISVSCDRPDFGLHSVMESSFCPVCLLSTMLQHLLGVSQW